MDLVIPLPSMFSAEDRQLIEKARSAVSLLHREFRTTKNGIEWTLWAEAVIWSKPLRLDFQATDGSPCQAFLGPQLSLTERLFHNGQLKFEVIQEFTEACAQFEQHLRSTQ